jgi:hypothetical protein
LNTCKTSFFKQCSHSMQKNKIQEIYV